MNANSNTNAAQAYYGDRMDNNENKTVDYSNLGRAYLDLKDSMEEDLSRSGFNPAKAPPGKEPKAPTNFSQLGPDTLRTLYDQYIAFYEYISDEITRLEVYVRTTSERTSLIHSHLVLEAMRNKKTLSNAEVRKAWVETQPAYQQALQDSLYFKQMLNAQEQRRRKMSKMMERVYWEIWTKTHPDQADRHVPDDVRAGHHERRSQHIRNMYRPINEEA
jgi:hypothetical protein